MTSALKLASHAAINPVTVLLETTPVAEYGESPDVAKMEVTTAFCDRLTALLKLCEEQKLEKVFAAGIPATWLGEDGSAIYVSVKFPSVVVSREPDGDYFWFESSFLDERIVTHAIVIQQFIEQVTNHQGDEPLVFADDPDELRVYIDQATEALAP